MTVKRVSAVWNLALGYFAFLVMFCIIGSIFFLSSLVELLTRRGHPAAPHGSSPSCTAVNLAGESSTAA